MYIIRNFIQLISYMIILYKVYFIIVYFIYVRIVIRKIQYIILITAVIYIYIYIYNRVYYTFELAYEKS